MGYFQVILAEFRSGRVKTGHVKRLLTFHLVRLGNISSRVILTFPYTPLVEVKQAQNTWSYRQISKFSTTWKYSQSGHTTHPSLDGHSRKIVTREVVYYILLGTLRSAQKCLWSNLRDEFSRDIHP